MSGDVLRQAAAQIRDDQSDADHDDHFMLAVADWLDASVPHFPIVVINPDALTVAAAYLGAEVHDSTCYSCQKGVTVAHRCPITLGDLNALLADRDDETGGTP